MPLKGLTPAVKTHYLFTRDQDDFAMFTGIKPFKLHNGRYGCITDRYIYIDCDTAEDIRGLTGIEVSMTEAFKQSTRHGTISEIKQEIEICNFKSNQHFNPQHIPSVLKEIMAENINPASEFKHRSPVVGMVVKLLQTYSNLGVVRGDYGIVVQLYGNNLESATILFANGQYCGFSSEEIQEDLQFSHLSTHRFVKEYIYSTGVNLERDFNYGIFDMEFSELYDDFQR